MSASSPSSSVHAGWSAKRASIASNDSGVWPLYRFDPRRIDQGEPPLVVDMPGGKIPVQEYMRNEARFRMVERMDPEAFRDFARWLREAELS